MAKVSHILVCQNVDCRVRGSDQVMKALSLQLAEKGRRDITVKSYMCFGACQAGPNMVFYPERTWYAGVRLSDVDAIVDHVMGGPKVEALEGKVDPALRELIYQLLDAGLF
ncbi:MAG: (2Fe-2S) ferredoxin domain-containing protein [Acidobacteria bacterium]|nr:(2Fe-2S) ferredoxin domain-containing protein [Acidobacteriota bacterium]MBI3658586.1 (2Fe-2S) ferredoxin domain-containing protein [Acidobacteriota bacterium]